ncbi:MAG TPA: SgcJ/EcaC family oxidoreductase [Mycobacterium sp.]|nr:SgcJ/EcaC family oxidoreductase [Mycobacterium sp.]
MRDTELLRGVLEHWKAGIDAHDPQAVAAVFTEDAIFQGLRPYSVGRDGVAEYYERQPLGMTVTYRVLETRRPTEELVLGYLRADFAFPDRPTVSVNIGVAVTHDNGWKILHYQASRLD